MIASTPNDVITLALSEKERMYSSKNRKGCHVFLSRYFLDFNDLTPETKTDLLYRNTNGPENLYDDVNSVDTPLPRKGSHAAKFVGRHGRTIAGSNRLCEIAGISVRPVLISCRFLEKLSKFQRKLRSQKLKL